MTGTLPIPRFEFEDAMSQRDHDQALNDVVTYVKISTNFLDSIFREYFASARLRLAF